MSAHIPYHPAPGMHGLMPGFVQLPVLTNALTYVAPSSGGSGPSAGCGGTMAVDAAGNLTPTFGMGRVTPGLGAFLAARFPVPQNPVRNWITGQPGMGGLGCGCGGSCGCGGGMGHLGQLGQLDFTLSDIMSGTAGIETYAVLGLGALALVWMLGGGKKKYRVSARQRAEKRAKISSAKAAYYRAMEGSDASYTAASGRSRR